VQGSTANLIRWRTEFRMRSRFFQFLKTDSERGREEEVYGNYRTEGRSAHLGNST
jgi:hypothetical protein